MTWCRCCVGMVEWGVGKMKDGGGRAYWALPFPVPCLSGPPDHVATDVAKMCGGGEQGV